MNAAAFLEALWGEQPPGLVPIWQLDGRRSYYLRAPRNVESYSGELTGNPATDLYCSVALAHRDHGRHRRPPADQAAGIAGLWLDIDIKPGSAESAEHAARIARAVCEPTLLVATGGGLHAWWLFERGPWRFASRDEQHAAAQAAAQWQQLHRQAAGVALDATHDLARLMRLPGTLNGKQDPPRPVSVLGGCGSRFHRDELLAHAAVAGPVELGASPAGTEPVDFAMGEVTPPLWLEAMCENDPDFARAWRHTLPGRGDWSMSHWDLSIASRLALANMTDQQIADAIRFHRALWGQPKDRADYLRRTISKARSAGGRTAALDALRGLAGGSGVAA